MQRLQEDAYPEYVEASGSSVYIQYQDLRANRTGMLLSTDRGNTWSLQNANMPHLLSLAATPRILHGIGLLGTNVQDAYYFQSTDYGLSWLFDTDSSLSRDDLAN